MATRSLGTLTLDLIAKVGGFERGMDKAERRSAKWKAKTKRQVEEVGRAFATLGVGVAAGLVAVTTHTINAGREITNLSKLANTSTQSFQKLAYGAGQYGISQEKVADILKDTSDKVGDFLQTGGGPLKDFFENIAPQVGVTAEQFRRLSGSEALGLYVKSLEAANLSQNEMTFYMEAIASDSTALLPLLKNNGQEFKRLGEEAEQFGVVISDIDLQALEDVKRETERAQGAFRGLGNQVAIATLPVIRELTSLLGDEATVEASKTLAIAIAKAFGAATEAIRGTVNVTKFLGEELAAQLNGAAADDIVRLQEKADEIREAMQGGLFGMGQRIRFFGKDGLVEYWDENEMKAELAAIEEAIAAAKKGIQARLRNQQLDGLLVDTSPRSGMGSGGITEPPEISKEAQRVLDSLKTDFEKYREDVAAITSDVALSVAEKSRALQMLSDSFADSLMVDESLLRERDNSVMDSINSQAQQIRDSLRTEEEAIEESYKRRRDIILNNTQYTGQAQTELLRRLEEERTEQLLEIERKKNAEIAEGYQVLLDVIGSYYQGMEGQQAAYARVALSLASVLLDEEKRSALGKIIANTQSAAMKAYESMAGIPIVGPALGAAAAATVTVAGAAAASKVIGIAHDGLDSVPTTGTYILEKGERVVTEKTSAKLDRKLDTVGNGQAQPMSMRINNILDPSFMKDYMGGAEGDIIIENWIDRNQTKIQSIAGGR